MLTNDTYFVLSSKPGIHPHWGHISPVTDTFTDVFTDTDLVSLFGGSVITLEGNGLITNIEIE